VTEQEIDATAVEIIAESGVRTIERNMETTVDRTLMTERNTVIANTPVAVWPRDTAAQRVWALSAMIQISNGFLKKDMTTEEMFTEAQRIVDWVNTGRDEG